MRLTYKCTFIVNVYYFIPLRSPFVGQRRAFDYVYAETVRQIVLLVKTPTTAVIMGITALVVVGGDAHHGREIADLSKNRCRFVV